MHQNLAVNVKRAMVSLRDRYVLVGGPKGLLGLGTRAAILILIPLAGLWYAEARRSRAELTLGSRLPPVQLETIVGPYLAPGQSLRPLMVVIFTASCPFCQEQLVRCDSLGRKFRGRIDILAISFSERSITETMLGAQSRPYSVAICGDSRAWSEWRITRVPTIFLLDPRGILIAQWTGVKPFEEEWSILEQLASIGPLRES